MAVTYQLETIPVWSALRADSECYLCLLEEECERRNTDFFLGHSIMVPEMRVEVNRHGFCPRHFHLLLGSTGKLGYSLALNTHREEVAGRLAALGRDLAAAGGKRGAAMKAVTALTEALIRLERDCLMCDRIRRNLANYSYTSVKLFETDPEFRACLAVSRGVCLHHLPLLLDMGVTVLHGDLLEEWHRMIVSVEEESLRRLGDELEQFSWQFDCQDDRTTPAGAQDSVARTVRKLAGYGPQRLP